MTTHQDWRKLLMDTSLANSYYWLLGDHMLPRIPEVESIIVSGLLIRSVSLLDDALEEYITAREIVVPQKNPKLFDRLRALKTAQLLVNYSDIDAWRKRRNDVGHEVTETYTWGELDSCHSAIYRELHHLNILQEFPTFKVTKTIQRVSPSSPDISLEQEIWIKVSENDVVAYEIGSRRYSRANH